MVVDVDTCRWRSTRLASVLLMHLPLHSAPQQTAGRCCKTLCQALEFLHESSDGIVLPLTAPLCLPDSSLRIEQEAKLNPDAAPGQNLVLRNQIVVSSDETLVRDRELYSRRRDTRKHVGLPLPAIPLTAGTYLMTDAGSGRSGSEELRGLVLHPSLPILYVRLSMGVQKTFKRKVCRLGLCVKRTTKCIHQKKARAQLPNAYSTCAKTGGPTPVGLSLLSWMCV